MAWTKNRTAVIGVGAALVVAVALGVAIAHHRDREHRRMFMIGADRYLAARQLVPGPFMRGPSSTERFGQGFGGAPGPGFGDAPGQGGPTTVMPPFAQLAPGSATGGFGAGVLHAQVTVPDGNGKYRTLDIQRGKVTKLTSHTLTVRSSDGYTQTYATSSELTRGVKSGDDVFVRADVSGKTTTITTLADLSRG